MVLVADLFSGLLAFVFGSAAVAKLLRQKQQVQTAEKLRIPWNRYRWIGAPEAAMALLAELVERRLAAPTPGGTLALSQ